MNRAYSIALLVSGIVFGPRLHAQLVLSGSSYTQNFDSIGSGLPTGWSVTTSAGLSTLGTTATFNTFATDWNTATSGTDFRNIAGSNIAYNSPSATQSGDTNRALGWRPLSASARTGAATLAIANTLGLSDFSLSLTVFQSNDVAPSGAESQTYRLEYRVGDTGDFSQLGSDFVTSVSGLTNFFSTTFSINGSALDPIANQSDSVYLRLRGVSSSGSGSMDTIGLDDFSLTYAPVPEPATYAFIAGLGVLGSALWRRRNLATIGASA